MPTRQTKRANFFNPPKQYRPLQIIHGFDTLKEGIEAGLDGLQRAGVGGVVTNVGFADGYLANPRQWDIFLEGIQATLKRGLRIWLYDEEGYPSGAAGGLVLQAHPEDEALGVACQMVEGEGPGELRLRPLQGALAVLGIWAIDEHGTQYEVKADDQAGELIWPLAAGRWRLCRFFLRHPYAGTHAALSVYVVRRYINVLDRQAVRHFINITHEAYAQRIGNLLGDKIEAVFTDEPSFMTPYIWPLPPSLEGKVPVKDPVPVEERYPTLPWVGGLPEIYQKRWGEDLVRDLPHLFFNLGVRSGRIREQYYEMLTELFASAYMEQLEEWCEAHGMVQSGHLLAEENLREHVGFLGDLLRLVGCMGLPGIDLLTSVPEKILAGEFFMAPKQVSSAAHLRGRQQVMSETSDWMDRFFGETDPTRTEEQRGASLAQMKGTANLLYCLGVNVITSYYDWHRPGYAEYTQYVGRLGSILADSIHQANCALLYPIRTAWAHFQPSIDNIVESKQDAVFQQVISAYPAVARALLLEQIDFDIIDEESLCRAENREGALAIGKERYHYLLLPPLDRLAPRTQQRIEEFVNAGGKLIALGEPTLTEWVRSLQDKGEVILAKATDSPKNWFRSPVTDWRIVNEGGLILVSHWIKDQEEFLFLINNSAQPATCLLHWEGITECCWPESGECEPWQGNRLNLGPYGAVFVFRPLRDIFVR